MHISSLPSKYGIGTLGREAYAFADFLKSAGQRYWQMLPVGQTGYGDSPYQSFSIYAGNPYFIDLDMLVEDGLLTHDELSCRDWGGDPRFVDYGAVYASRFSVLHTAFERGRARYASRLSKFIGGNAWVRDYALFMALKKHFGMAPWQDWPDEDIRLRRPGAMERYTELLHDDIEFYEFLQLLFYTQWDEFKSYVAGLGIKLIGDLPIYVAMDSADAWAQRENFLLDRDGRPEFVSGVPPDYFSSTGQLWGNPLYDWGYMQNTGYDWWLKRIEAASRIFDVIRIDHFRGLESYWRVPYGSVNAVNGEWVKGPGMDFVNAVKGRFPGISIIAEDLGFLTDDVRALLKASGFPGMKVLQFAFDSREPSDYLPHTYSPNCVCYTGTHDNTTAAGWFSEAAPEDVDHAIEYLGLNDWEGYEWGMIRGGMGSTAELFVAQMQDYLGHGSKCRMNIPGTVGGNWCWRLLEGECGAALAQKIAKKTYMYGRL